MKLLRLEVGFYIKTVLLQLICYLNWKQGTIHVTELYEYTTFTMINIGKLFRYTSELLIYNIFNVTLGFCCSEFVDCDITSLN